MSQSENLGVLNLVVALSLAGSHDLLSLYRENRRRHGAGSQAGGAVGGADGGEECCAGALPRQRDPRGTCRLVRLPFSV